MLKSILQQKKDDIEAIRTGTTYKSGIGMVDSDDEDELKDGADVGKKGTKKKEPGAKGGGGVCKSCGLEGHQRRSSKDCLMNPKRIAVAGENNAEHGQ